MFTLEEAEERFLKASIGRGEVVLVLGAGVSATSKNRAGEGVAQSGKLAEIIANTAGQSYSDESLWEVLSAIKGEFLSNDQINSVLSEQYSGISPSEELIELFHYTWKRAYTWNIDDAIENISTRSAQRRKIFNGIIDKPRNLKAKKYFIT